MSRRKKQMVPRHADPKRLVEVYVYSAGVVMECWEYAGVYFPKTVWLPPRWEGMTSLLTGKYITFPFFIARHDPTIRWPSAEIMAAVPLPIVHTEFHFDARLIERARTDSKKMMDDYVDRKVQESLEKIYKEGEYFDGNFYYRRR
jgi:hypothetical protein